MKIIEAQAGLGMGVDKFRVVFLFDNERAFNDLVNKGWEFGGQSTAAAKNTTVSETIVVWMRPALAHGRIAST